MSATLSPNRVKKNAKKAAKASAPKAEDPERLLRRISNLFLLEAWSIERISEAVDLTPAEVIFRIQNSQLDNEKAATSGD